MFVLKRESDLPLYKQIRDQLKDLIQSKFFKPDLRLPSTRKLAKDLQINRNTVLLAYAELEAEGLIYSIPGKGLYVENIDNAKSQEYQQDSTWIKKTSPEASPASRTCQATTSDDLLDLPSNEPEDKVQEDESLYPTKLIKRSFHAALKESGPTIFSLGSIQGYLPLREFLTKRMTVDGIQTTPGHLCTTNGAHQAYSLILKILIKPGDYIAIEEPTSADVLTVLRSLQAKILGIPLEPDGLNIKILEEYQKRYPLKAVFATPNFHNPTGITMSFAKRQALLEISEKYGLLVIEDDAFGDLRLSGKDIPSLKSLDRTDHIIHLKSFSAVLPGIGIGYAILLDSLKDKFIIAKMTDDGKTSMLTQAILYKFLSRGFYNAVLKKVRRVYKEKRNLMIRSFQEYFPKEIKLIKPEGGCFIWVRFPEKFDLRPFMEKDRRFDIPFRLGYNFYSKPNGYNELRLCYTSVSLTKIEPDIRNLAKIILAGAGERPSLERR